MPKNSRRLSRGNFEWSKLSVSPAAIVRRPTTARQRKPRHRRQVIFNHVKGSGAGWRFRDVLLSDYSRGDQHIVSVLGRIFAERGARRRLIPRLRALRVKNVQDWGSRPAVTFPAQSGKICSAVRKSCVLATISKPLILPRITLMARIVSASRFYPYPLIRGQSFGRGAYKST